MPVDTRRRPPSLDPGAPARAAVRPSGTGGRSGADGRAKRPRRKDPLWARIMVIVGAVLMMTSGVAIVGSKALISQATGDIEQTNLLGDAGKSDAEGGKDLNGPIDLLLLGVDARARLSADDVRADTIIILHIPATHDQAYLISIPRDTEAHIPAFKKTGYHGGVDKINAAFQAGARNGGGWEGGAQLMAQTIKKMTGVSFDGAAIINFGGFKKIIDALGSVRICVAQETKSIHMSMVDGKPMWNADAKKTGRKMTPVVHKKGCREMKGWEALDYSRQRKELKNGDYDRQQNQQQLIKAMAKKATEGGVNVVKLNRLIKAAGEALVLDTGGVDVADFVFTMRGVTGNELTLLRTNGGTFATGGSGREVLNEQSLEMFRAVKEDRLAEFVYANPEVLSDRK
ncbi:LytR family transcriptional regulator [Micromonospora echinofusca]|uniref:LytR family transcriptional regulator n=2 Tax=Micromonospora echinofusca TaxID=47858 RepID=A0ABS3VXV2_MICEH|nr:LCP family protein [Micromonospora echinofusca]MBO4209357.1 LytR family transcriptional regulator [Micromonospora echinofusca]